MGTVMPPQLTRTHEGDISAATGSGRSASGAGEVKQAAWGWNAAEPWDTEGDCGGAWICDDIWGCGTGRAWVIVAAPNAPGISADGTSVGSSSSLESSRSEASATAPTAGSPPLAKS
ncbi:hypothetical protein [uncultured Parolsenella sp.]|uniref:hypothetical protein n=1 Tax=uncultured Parolsenella sp. TaxID=2083008 RepID=UPI002659E1B7|nr:hypothetical protein [uncultured Parolsenella sp.]